MERIVDHLGVRDTANLARTSKGMATTFGNVVDRELQKAVGATPTDANFGDAVIGQIEKDPVKQRKYFVRLLQMRGRFPQPTNEWLSKNHLVNEWMARYADEYVDRQLQAAVGESETANSFGDNVIDKIVADDKVKRAYFERLHQLRRHHEKLVTTWLAKNKQVEARFDAYLLALRKPSKTKPGSDHRGSVGNAHGESRGPRLPYGTRLTDDQRRQAEVTFRLTGSEGKKFQLLSGCSPQVEKVLPDATWPPSSNDLAGVLKAVMVMLDNAHDRHWLQIHLFSSFQGETFENLKRAVRKYIQGREELSEKKKRELLKRIPK